MIAGTFGILSAAAAVTRDPERVWVLDSGNSAERLAARD
jgi:hypothetical protein